MSSICFVAKIMSVRLVKYRSFGCLQILPPSSYLSFFLIIPPRNPSSFVLQSFSLFAHDFYLSSMRLHPCVCVTIPAISVLVSNAPHEMHVHAKEKEHKRLAAARCKRRIPVRSVDNLIVKHHKSWQAQLPLCPHRPELASWLFFPKSGGGGGCKDCFLSNVDSVYGLCKLTTKRQLKLARFRCHQSTLTHKAAVAVLTKCPSCTSAAEEMKTDAVAQSCTEFRDVWKARRQGGALRQIDGVGCKNKMQRIQQCLGEAMKLIEHTYIDKSESIALHFDGRKPRLTLRFNSCGISDSSARRGLVGHVNYVKGKTNCADTSTAIGNSISDCLREFSTVMKGTRIERFDESVFSKLRHNTELVDADAEQVAQLAAEMCSNTLLDERDPLFVGGPKVLQDPTHAGRRTACE